MGQVINSTAGVFSKDNKVTAENLLALSSRLDDDDLLAIKISTLAKTIKRLGFKKNAPLIKIKLTSDVHSTQVPKKFSGLKLVASSIMGFVIVVLILNVGLVMGV